MDHDSVSDDSSSDDEEPTISRLKSFSDRASTAHAKDESDNEKSDVDETGTEKCNAGVLTETAEEDS